MSGRVPCDPGEGAAGRFLWAASDGAAGGAGDASDGQLNRREQLKGEGGVGFCNITKCCTEVCPEHIHITDNAIIPLKERVADDYFDPLRGVFTKIGLMKPKEKKLAMSGGSERADAGDCAAAAGE